MLLALCCLLTLWIDVVSSVSVPAAAVHECHPWSFYNDTLQRCQCYESASDFYIYRFEITECLDRKAAIRIGYCMTTEELGTFITFCAAYMYSLNLNITEVNGMYIQLPNNVSELNDLMCGSMNRKGRVCGECVDGYAP